MQTLNLHRRGGNGVSHCYFRLAVNEGYLRSDGTNAVSFIPCNIGGKRAESIAPYLKQGMRLTVTGSISVRSNKLADGQYSDSCMLSVDQVFFRTAGTAERSESGICSGTTAAVSAAGPGNSGTAAAVPAAGYSMVIRLREIRHRSRSISSRPRQLRHRSRSTSSRYSRVIRLREIRHRSRSISSRPQQLRHRSRSISSLYRIIRLQELRRRGLILTITHLQTAQ